jgi:glutamate synthase domain-containing protein 1/glutamate synthase domain-containing protein 3
MPFDKNSFSDRLLQSRFNLPRPEVADKKPAEEGGCGVTGFIASVPVRGRHIFEPSIQMHNRGNGKGGGIAAVGMVPEDMGVPRDVLDTHYMLQVALLDDEALPDVEAANITPHFEINNAYMIDTVDDYRDIEGLEVKPPDVRRYFVRVKSDVLDRFIEENNFGNIDPARVEDEFIYQNSFKLNQAFYSSLGKQRAFVLSHGRDMMILKIVGYAEKVVEYYKMEDTSAHAWIAHQRYPTKGRVWHPGGAHPFNGLDEALVHNGDFANYHSVSEYLKQQNIFPQFLTDTEVAILLFDLLKRSYDYPLEYIIEAMAPTTEHDFDLLPSEKQEIYRYLQAAHIHGSPDGPWFFILALNNPYEKFKQLIGITDTAMLRPQVFAFQDGEVQIGLICSEKQAIDATLQNLAAEDDRFCPVADKYWNARGGSATDGGAFIFTLRDDNGNGQRLTCTNKFGEEVKFPQDQEHYRPSVELAAAGDAAEIDTAIKSCETAQALIDFCLGRMKESDYASLKYLLDGIVELATNGNESRDKAIEVLTYLNDMRYCTGNKKRGSVLNMLHISLSSIFEACPQIENKKAEDSYRLISWDNRDQLRAPVGKEKILVIDGYDFEPEGDDCDSRLIVAAFHLGWKRFVCFRNKGQRFHGCGLGPNTEEVRIDCYDSSGDYLASGIDGLEIYVHGNAQDQLGQILKRGKVVIYGDVGQTFMYGAKGGDVYILGNAAGRPLINAVGRPKVVINGSVLDYLAESFMAGDPLTGGGFVILNSMQFNDDGDILPLDAPYPGSNLFSLASGGAIYVRDPYKKIVDEQLNGGELVDLSAEDWELILPFLQENERLFGISIDNDLLMVNGEKKNYAAVYRKVQAAKSDVLTTGLVVNEEYE